MKNITKKDLVTELMALGAKDDKALLRETKTELMRILDVKRTQAKPTKNEENFIMTMKENFVVGARDAGLTVGNLKKAKPAVEAVKAVKADKKAGIEAVKAVPAKEATPAAQQVHLDCVSEEVFQEVKARMEDQGFKDIFEGQITMSKNNRFRLMYVAENDKIIRAAFKKCKAKDGYNAPGLAALAAAAKSEKAAAKAAEPKKKAPAKKANPVKAEKAEEAEEGDGWPEEFEE